MADITWIDDTARRVTHDDQASFQESQAWSALRNLPDHSIADVGEIARCVGIEKLTLIRYVRADARLARLVASKVLK